MKLAFSKYHGTGNDFILVDNRNGDFIPGSNVISLLCHRRYGIGADGFMTLQNSDIADFEMKYYNADGNESTMCGNGGRCIAAFAKHLGLAGNKTVFSAIDGLHNAEILFYDGFKATVDLQLKDVDNIERGKDYFFLNTGSPHYVKFVDNLSGVNIIKEGKRIRWDDRFAPEGTNVNFAEIGNGVIRVATYERGVEDETLSCGTGVTAVALAASELSDDFINQVKISTKGGELTVKFEKKDSGFVNVRLVGPVVKVFSGTVEI